ncbi:MAG: Competence protein ComM [bacterium ADurb.Bin400]|nr:MAG: Competence protein ComM [bacterium ADurb.Bin400]
MDEEEVLEVTKIHSVAGMLQNKRRSLVKKRPFRSPHHTTSNVALVGGGQWPRPGEISLAHRGVLFLDEFPEFSRSVLEALRQPLEDGVVTVSRAQGSLCFPARFLMVAAQNPCPCGFRTDPDKACVCTPSQIVRYENKISGPILDRIDLHVEVPRIGYEELRSERVAEESVSVKKRVKEARWRQSKRFISSPIKTNAEMRSKDIKQACTLDAAAERLVGEAVDRMKLSGRVYHRILKVARTIADLEGSELISASHVGEALQYRPRERTY